MALSAALACAGPLGFGATSADGASTARCTLLCLHCGDELGCGSGCMRRVTYRRVWCVRGCGLGSGSIELLNDINAKRPFYHPAARESERCFAGRCVVAARRRAAEVPPRASTVGSFPRGPPCISRTPYQEGKLWVCSADCRLQRSRRRLRADDQLPYPPADLEALASC